MLWPAAVAPDGWHLLDGAALSRTTYAELFALIGTTFGAGDSTTTFNLPNIAGRVPCGPESGFALGATRGAATHTNTEAEMVAHRHNQNLWGNLDAYPAQWAPSAGGTSYNSYYIETDGGNGVATVQTGSKGSGTAYSILNPQLSLNFIMYIGGAAEEEDIIEKFDTLNGLIAQFLPEV